MLQTLAKILSVLSSKQSYDVNNRLLSEVMKQTREDRSNRNYPNEMQREKKKRELKKKKEQRT